MKAMYMRYMVSWDGWQQLLYNWRWKQARIYIRRIVIVCKVGGAVHAVQQD